MLNTSSRQQYITSIGSGEEVGMKWVHEVLTTLTLVECRRQSARSEDKVPLWPLGRRREQPCFVAPGSGPAFNPTAETSLQCLVSGSFSKARLLPLRFASAYERRV